MIAPFLYDPFSVEDPTETTWGPLVSITIFLLKLSEPWDPGFGKDKLALLPILSLTVKLAPYISKAVLDLYDRSVEFSLFNPTLYKNSNMVVPEPLL